MGICFLAARKLGWCGTGRGSGESGYPRTEVTVLAVPKEEAVGLSWERVRRTRSVWGSEPGGFPKDSDVMQGSEAQ